MRKKEKEEQYFTNHSTVYGPVASWRFGASLGIDPIFNTSTCSFNCIYCQLGHIQNITREFKEYVATERVISDYLEFIKKDDSQRCNFNTVTYSGSGEPTLAKNLGAIIAEIRKISPNVPQIVLTNATELRRQEVLDNIMGLDRIIVKIDAPNEEIFKSINRPAAGITLASVVENIIKLKSVYKGTIEVQSMFMPINADHIESFTEILKKVRPDSLQLNTPRRPYPTEWHRENRGNHLKIYDYETKQLRTITNAQIKEIGEEIERLSNVPVVGIS